MLEGIQRLGEQRLLLLSHVTEIKINSLEKTIELTQNVLCATKTNLQQNQTELYHCFAYNFQKCSQVHTAVAMNKLVFHMKTFVVFS